MPTFKRRSAPANTAVAYQRRVRLPAHTPSPARLGTNYVGGIGDAPAVKPPSDRKVSRIALDLSIARTKQLFSVAGETLWVKNGSAATATFDAAFDDANADAIPLVPGDATQGFTFGKFYVTNTAQAGMSVTLIVMSGGGK